MTTKMQERNCTVQFRGAHNVARITLLVRFAQVAFKIYSDRIQTHETGREWRRKIRFETIFQAQLYGISMAMKWIQSQSRSISACAINVDSRAALLSIANKQTTHPLATAIREKIINLRHTTSVTLHWVKGHAGLNGNETADYLAKTAASYCTIIAYDKKSP